MTVTHPCETAEGCPGDDLHVGFVFFLSAYFAVVADQVCAAQRLYLLTSIIEYMHWTKLMDNEVTTKQERYSYTTNDGRRPQGEGAANLTLQLPEYFNVKRQAPR